MALDGLFLHHLISEIKEDIIDKKIYHIISINNTDYVFNLQNKKNLLICVNPTHPNIRLSKNEYIPATTILSNYFKKHIEGGIIKDINQYKNDRLVIIDIDAFDDLGYTKEYRIYIELMGKNSNLIITDRNNIILDAIKKSYLTDSHLIKTGIKYIPIEDNKISPYDTNSNEILLSNIQGLSKQVINEINARSLNEVLNEKIKPCLIEGDKTIFYYFDLKTIIGKRTYFDSLSELLEYYYDVIQKQTNDNRDLINTKKYIEEKIEKTKNKLEKQKIELENAKDISTLEKYANNLKANFYLIKPYMDNITLKDYETGENIKIPLNPKLKPNENIEYYFNKIKKNKRTIIALEQTISNTIKDIDYYTENLSYLDYSKAGDLKEIMQELGLKKQNQKNVKPHIAKYIDNDGNIYYFGKNNIQNNYLTHQFAKDDDFWFHAKSIPGSHVILRGKLNDKSIAIASNIAAFYSKAKESLHVCVDYTLVKWVKKIKGEKGSSVIYTHEKTYYSDPNIDFINQNAKLN